MHSFHKEKSLPNSCTQIVEIVLDIESYPSFVPWCEAIRIISRNEAEIIAEMKVNYKGFIEKYKSRVTTRKLEEIYIVEVKAMDGPFNFLNNVWRISPEVSGCKVDFLIELEFKSFLLDKMIGLFFMNAAEKMMEAFENRAKTGYLA